MEREFFTRHGLHLNRKGKEKMAEKLASTIQEIMKPVKKHCEDIPMPSNETVPHQQNQEMETTQLNSHSLEGMKQNESSPILGNDNIYIPDNGLARSPATQVPLLEENREEEAPTKSSSDPTPNGNDPGTTTKLLKEEEKSSTIPIPSECVLIDIKEGMRQPISAISAINENEDGGNKPRRQPTNVDTSVPRSTEQPKHRHPEAIDTISNRTSTRQKKPPITRKNDFLWITI